MRPLILRIQYADGATEELSLHSELVVEAVHGATYSILNKGSGKIISNLVAKRVKDSLLIQMGEARLVEVGGYYCSDTGGNADLRGLPFASFDLGANGIVTPDSLITLLPCRFVGPEAPKT